MGVEGPEKIVVEPEYVMQALQSSLAEERHKSLMLTALVNQQKRQIEQQASILEAMRLKEDVDASASN